MKHFKHVLVGLLAVGMVSVSSIPSFAALNGIHWTWGSITNSAEVTVAPETKYRTLSVSSPIGPQKIHSIEFNPKNQFLELRAGMSHGKVNGTQTVAGMAADFNKKKQGQVIAGINGDYFHFGQGVPFGIFMDKGEILSTPPQYSTAFGIKNDGTPFVVSHGTILNQILHVNNQKIHLTGINNRHQDKNSLILYNNKFASSTKAKKDSVEVVCDVLSGEVRHGQMLHLKISSIKKQIGDTPIPANKMVLSALGSYKETLSALQVGQEIQIELKFNQFWSDVKFAIAGNYLLLQNGNIQNISGKERAPRTVIGVKPDGNVVFYTIDGRMSDYSVGATYQQAATIMRDLGCTDAVNLDGGGSTTFVLRNLGAMDAKMINRSADGGARAVANGALLINTAPVTAPSKLILSPSGSKLLLGGNYSFKVIGAMDHNLLSYPVPNNISWWVDETAGSISSQGVLHPTRPGGVLINATSGSASGVIAADVVDHITAIQTPSKLTIKANAKQTISPTLLVGNQSVLYTPNLLTWEVEGNIGIFTAPGVFVANRAAANGYINIRYKNISKKIPVTIDGPEPEVFEKFKDMGTHRWAKEAVYRLYNAGVIYGVTENTFVPAAPIKRADFILMLMRLMNIPIDQNPTNQFADVPKNAYYYKELATAKRLGIAQGTTPTTFNPERHITREEMFSLTWRILKQFGYLKTESPLHTLNQFADHRNIASFAQQATATLVGNQLIKGDNHNCITPKAKTLRADAAVFLDRVREFIK